MKILIIICIPLLSILLLSIKDYSRKLFYISICSLSIINISLLSILESHFQKIYLNPFTVILLDKYSWFFAIVINICWLLTTIYSFSFVKYDFQKRAKKFHFYLSLTLFTALGSSFAGNLNTLFFFYLASIPLIYPLISLRDNKEAKKAAKNYLINNLAPALLILIPAILLCNFLTHNAAFSDPIPESFYQKPYLVSLILALFIIGMSKNCVFPFNRWLPESTPAPAPVTALLHSVAVVKIGSISLIKIVVYIYHLDFLYKLSHNFFMTGWLTYLCGFTALYAAFKALKTDNLKVRFSESTVSQLSYIITAILTGTTVAILGAKMHIITHAIAKCCLFFIAGYYNCVYKTLSIREISQIAPNKKLLNFSIIISGLSIAGFPFLAGYLSKDLMLIEELHSGNYAAVFFLVIGSILNLLYILPLAKASFTKEINPRLENLPIPFSMKLAISLATLLIIFLSVFSGTVLKLCD